MDTPARPGRYRYTPALAGAASVTVNVVRDGDALMVKLPPDLDDDAEIYPVEDLSGTWERD